ncbi:MAG: hypothetical protein WEC80_00975 [Patescibacteria group bacterium]
MNHSENPQSHLPKSAIFAMVGALASPALLAACGNDNGAIEASTSTISSTSTTEVLPTTTSSTLPEATTIPETTTTTEALPTDRFEYYAKDFQEAYPELTKEQVKGELENLAGLVTQIEPVMNFVASTTNSGIERDPGTGHPLDYEGPVIVNAPEGAYAYLSHGRGTLTAPNGFQIELPWKENNVYLTYIRGVADDGTSADLNQGWKFNKFAVGFAYKNHAADTRHEEVNTDNGQIINLEQFSQDMLYAAMSGTNCGATGCEYTITTDFIDAKGIENGDENAWTRVTFYPIYGEDNVVNKLAYVAINMITGEFLPTPINNS